MPTDTSSLLAAVVVALSVAAHGQVPGCGDCDGTGDVTIVDALVAAQHAVGVTLIASPELDACDVQPVSGDGVLSITDALRIAQSVVGLPVSLGCTVPSVLFEGFDAVSLRDELLTDADWGVALPSELSAPTLPATGESFAAAAMGSSVPFRDAGSRTQILLRPSDLQYQGGRLQALQLFLAEQEEADRTYTGLEVRACHTTVSSLGSIFQANYAGNQPVLIKSPATEVYGQGVEGSLLDLRIAPGAFNYDGVANLLIEILHHGASAQTVVLADGGLAHAARVHSSSPTDTSGYPAMLGTRVRAIFDGGFQPTSEAVSLFFDTGSASPTYRPATADTTLPPGTDAQLFLQGAPDDGAGQPFMAATTGWVPAVGGLPGGMRHVRFRVILAATALETPLVHRVRIPYDP